MQLKERAASLSSRAAKLNITISATTRKVFDSIAQAIDENEKDIQEWNRWLGRLEDKIEAREIDTTRLRNKY
ncbi:MAG: hypothetical protein LBC09_05050 [Helicobacteraceae bacterium]|jgi:hypothetical protein|nr:hypothetical protein [Helicobacteraceae bacterium]